MCASALSDYVLSYLALLGERAVGWLSEPYRRPSDFRNCHAREGGVRHVQ